MNLLVLALLLVVTGMPSGAERRDLEAKLYSGDPAAIAEARRRFDQIAREAALVNNQDWVVYARWKMAYCDFMLGKRERAQADLEELLTTFPDSGLRLLIHRDLGQFYQVDWRTKAAQRHLTKALEISPGFVFQGRRNEMAPIAVLQIRFSMAINLLMMTNNEDAREQLQYVAKDAAKLAGPQASYLHAECQINLADLDKRDGKAFASISRLRMCLGKLESLDTRESIERKFSCYLSIAKDYRGLTRFSDASAELDRAEQLIKENPDKISTLHECRHRVELETARGELALESTESSFEDGGDHEKLLRELDNAERSANEATKWHQKLTEQKTKQSGANLVLLAAIEKLRGRILRAQARSQEARQAFQRGIQRYTSGIELFQELLDPKQDLILGLRRDRAWLHQQLGDKAHALSETRAVFESLAERYGEGSLQTALDHQMLIELEAESGNLQEAVKHAEIHRRITNQHLLPYAAGLTPAAQQRFFRRWCDPALHSALRLAVNDKTLAAQSAEWLMNGKAKSAEVLGRVSQQSRRGDSAVAFREAIAHQAYLLYGPEQSDVQAKLLSLESRKRQLSEMRAGTLPTIWHELGDLHQQLQNDEVLIDIFCLKDDRQLERTYCAWIVGRSQAPQVITLGDANAIDKLVDGLIDDLEGYTGPYTLNSSPSVARREQQLRQNRLQPLSELLLKPIWDAVDGQRRWIISPDGALWNLPWAALPIPESEDYAVEHLTIRYVISARELIFRDKAEKNLGPAMVVADPSYNARQPGTDGRWRVSKADALQTEGPQVYERLRGGDGKAVLYTQDAANKDSILGITPAPQILYLATHGKFLESAQLRVDDPFLCCYLVLSGYNFLPAGKDRIREVPGVLTGAEVLLANLKGTELVVLSACQTGRGIAAYSHSAASLRHAFHLAGARAVVSSLWSVADEPTSELMLAFIDRVQRKHGSDKAESLRYAQVEMIKRLRNGYYERKRDEAKTCPAHPFLWAAFSVSGF